MTPKFILAIILGSILISLNCNAQKKPADRYIDSSETQLKKYAAEIFYDVQLNLIDSVKSMANPNNFSLAYFEYSNYQLDAINIILDYATKEASKQLNPTNSYPTGSGCFCLQSTLEFYTSKGLKKKIRSLRKYLEPKGVNKENE